MIVSFVLRMHAGLNRKISNSCRSKYLNDITHTHIFIAVIAVFFRIFLYILVSGDVANFTKCSLVATNCQTTLSVKCAPFAKYRRIRCTRPHRNQRQTREVALVLTPAAVRRIRAIGRCMLQSSSHCQVQRDRDGKLKRCQSVRFGVGPRTYHCWTLHVRLRMSNIN